MINNITLKKSAKIINNEYVIKPKTKDLTDTFNYLLSRSFDYYPQIIKQDSNNIYYEYIEDIKESNEQKMLDLINLVALLHTKTTIYKEIDLSTYKTLYESLSDKIKNTYDIYNNLMDRVEETTYMSPSDYLLARNITPIYYSLNNAKEKLDTWYKHLKDTSKVRLVTIHNNLKLEHYLKSNKPYLISWDKSSIDIPIFDLVSLYQNNYHDFEFVDLLNSYLTKYPLTEAEQLLFLSIIAIPKTPKEVNNEYNRIIDIKSIINYVSKTNAILIKYSVTNESKKD